MIRQVIFDCDGVLVDTEIVAAHVMVDALSEYKIDITTDYYLETFTGSTFSVIFESLIKDISDKELNVLIERCEIKVYEDLKAIKGMPELVKSIKLPKAVVSNSFLWQVEKALKLTQLENDLTQRFSAQMVEKPKPAPEIYQLAAKQTGFLPEECLVIEDSKSGVTAARAANMNVIGFCGGSHIRNGHGEALKEKGAMLTADSPETLLLAINDFIKV